MGMRACDTVHGDLLMRFLCIVAVCTSDTAEEETQTCDLKPSLDAEGCIGPALPPEGVQIRRGGLRRMPSLEEIDDELVESQIDEMLGSGGQGAADSPVLVEVRRSLLYNEVSYGWADV